MDYDYQHAIDAADKGKLDAAFGGVVTALKHVSVSKALALVLDIPQICRMHHLSILNRQTKSKNPKKYHPVLVEQGDVYNAYITHGVGSELCGAHLVVIVQNINANLYSEKVNIVPIEGDGNTVKHYNYRLTNADMFTGSLSKDPSKIVITDIMTVDKARLGRKIGKVTPECLAEIKKKLAQQFSL